MPERRFRTLERLIQQANRTSSSKPNSAQMLAEVIRVITDDGSDPYLVLGVGGRRRPHLGEAHSARTPGGDGRRTA
jgi:hypothetical protein